MKRQIRNGVFETNSSSMHSLVIKKRDEYYTKDEVLYDIWLDVDGIWNLHSESSLTFGRSPFKCLNSFGMKVRYAIASLCGANPEPQERFQEIEDIVMCVIPECFGIKLPKFIPWYETDSVERAFYGNVDENRLSSFLKNENITVEEFLTNKKYVVIVDGDEYCVWDSLKRSGLVNMDEIEKEY